MKAMVTASPAGGVLHFGPLFELLDLQIYQSRAEAWPESVCVFVCVFGA